MSEKRRDIQFSPVESGPSGSPFASLSPKTEREAQAKAPEFFAPVQTDQPAASPMEISPAKDRAMRIAKPLDISPAREWGTLPPPMPKHLETFPTPRRTFERTMASMRERMERDEHIPSLDLIATHESYHARDLDREEALRNIEALAEKLKTLRERRGDKRMIQELTKRIYARRYHLEQNTMLGLFTGQERGNCQATAKAASTILEEIGLDPKTEIAHQMFSDHVRTLAKLNERWWVLEGRARPLRDKETLGTTIVSLEDEKRGLLGMESSSPIELGETPFHKPDGTLENRSLFSWIATGLERVDRAMRSRVSQKTPGISRHTGNRPAELPGTTTLMALLGTVLPLSKRRMKTVASTMAALSFLYAANRYRDPNVKTMEDLAEAIHDDAEHLKRISTAAVGAVASFMEQELPDVRASVALEPLPHGSRRRRYDDAEPVEP